MNFADETVLRIGAWRVDPATDEISRGTETHKLEPRTMRLLLYLAAHHRQVVDVHRLLDEVWPGVVVTPGSVYQAIAQLRRLLGDNAEQPSYIDTHSRKGYRLVASVSPWVEPDRGGQPPAGVDATAPHPGSLRGAAGVPSRRRVLIAALAKLQSLRGDNAALAYAMICGQRGDKGKALEWLDKATRLHDPWLQFLKVLALFDPLREEPRFEAIERELKFPD
jgi:DNA-binding winged helix-turn-helix (wHTH) protein